MPRTPTGESSLARAIRVLEAFEPGETTLGITSIAHRAGLPVSTTSRLVAELVEHGLLTRGPGRSVQVGVRLWELGLRASPTLMLRQAALPVLKDLTTVVGHHAQLSVLDGHEVLFLERVSAPDAVVNTSRVAGRMAVNATSPGILLAAHCPPARQETILAQPFRIHTRHTIATVDGLRRAMADARRNGYAIAPGSVHPAATGMAAPVREPGGRVVAALSLIVPNDDTAHRHLPTLIAGARGVSGLLQRAIGDARSRIDDRGPSASSGHSSIQ